jgi:hypothetical protein
MARFLALDAIFFLLPFAVYALWLVATRGSFRDIADWQARTIAWLAVVGAALMIVTLVTFTQFQQAPASGNYTPTRFEDGVRIPGHVEPEP